MKSKQNLRKRFMQCQDADEAGALLARMDARRAAKRRSVKIRVGTLGLEGSLRVRPRVVTLPPIEQRAGRVVAGRSLGFAGDRARKERAQREAYMVGGNEGAAVHS